MKKKTSTINRCVMCIRRWPLTTFCVLLIWVLCFFTPPSTPLDKVSMIDKWTHLVMYGGTVGVFFWEYWWSIRRGRSRIVNRKLRLAGFWAPLFMGGLIEILQAYCTGGRRSGDWADWVADAIGVVVGVAIGWGLMPRLCGVPRRQR